MSSYAMRRAALRDAKPAGGRYTVEECLRRGRLAFSRRDNMNRLYQAIAEMFYPERADFVGAYVPGDERYIDIFDEEPMLLRRNLSNQIGALIRPRGQEWFRCWADPEALNEEDAVRIWCERATKITRNVVYASSSHFPMAMSESDNDYVAFGTAVCTHTYTTDRMGLLFNCVHLRDVAWFKNADGKVDEIVHRMTISLNNLKVMGMELPRDWAKLHAKQPHEEVEVWRYVYPAKEYTGDRGLPRNARYAVMYIAVACNDELKASDGSQPFFRTFPYWIREWSNVSGEPAGRSPCTSVALATARGLNQVGLSIIESLEKLVSPPLIAPDDGIAGEVQIRANGITYYDPELNYGSRDPIQALPVGRPDFGMEYAEERRQFMARAFLQNIINFPGVTKEMTAYEARRLWEQYMRDAAPVFEPLEADNGNLMEPVFERIWDADGPGKSGPYPPPPDELVGAEVKFKFRTPLSEAYDRIEFEKAVEANQYIAGRAQINPGVVDLIDQDKMDRDALRAVVPQSWIRPALDVQRVREEKQQQQIEAMAANVALQAANAQMTGDPKGAPQVPHPDPIERAMGG